MSSAAKKNKANSAKIKPNAHSAKLKVPNNKPKPNSAKAKPQANSKKAAVHVLNSKSSNASNTSTSSKPPTANGTTNGPSNISAATLDANKAIVSGSTPVSLHQSAVYITGRYCLLTIDLLMPINATTSPAQPLGLLFHTYVFANATHQNLYIIMNRIKPWITALKLENETNSNDSIPLQAVELMIPNLSFDTSNKLHFSFTPPNNATKKLITTRNRDKSISPNRSNSNSLKNTNSQKKLSPYAEHANSIKKRQLASTSSSSSKLSKSNNTNNNNKTNRNNASSVKEKNNSNAANSKHTPLPQKLSGEKPQLKSATKPKPNAQTETPPKRLVNGATTGAPATKNKPKQESAHKSASLAIKTPLKIKSSSIKPIPISSIKATAVSPETKPAMLKKSSLSTPIKNNKGNNSSRAPNSGSGRNRGSILVTNNKFQSPASARENQITLKQLFNNIKKYIDNNNINNQHINELISTDNTLKIGNNPELGPTDDFELALHRLQYIASKLFLFDNSKLHTNTNINNICDTNNNCILVFIKILINCNALAVFCHYLRCPIYINSNTNNKSPRSSPRNSIFGAINWNSINSNNINSIKNTNMQIQIWAIRCLYQLLLLNSHINKCTCTTTTTNNKSVINNDIIIKTFNEYMSELVDDYKKLLRSRDSSKPTSPQLKPRSNTVTVSKLTLDKDNHTLNSSTSSGNLSAIDDGKFTELLCNSIMELLVGVNPIETGTTTRTASPTNNNNRKYTLDTTNHNNNHIDFDKDNEVSVSYSQAPISTWKPTITTKTNKSIQIMKKPIIDSNLLIVLFQLLPLTHYQTKINVLKNIILLLHTPNNSRYFFNLQCGFQSLIWPLLANCNNSNDELYKLCIAIVTTIHYDWLCTQRDEYIALSPSSSTIQLEQHILSLSLHSLTQYTHDNSILLMKPNMNSPRQMQLSHANILVLSLANKIKSRARDFTLNFDFTQQAISDILLQTTTIMEEFIFLVGNYNNINNTKSPNNKDNILSVNLSLEQQLHIIEKLSNPPEYLYEPSLSSDTNSITLYIQLTQSIIDMLINCGYKLDVLDNNNGSAYSSIEKQILTKGIDELKFFKLVLDILQQLITYQHHYKNNNINNSTNENKDINNNTNTTHDSKENDIEIFKKFKKQLQQLFKLREQRHKSRAHYSHHAHKHTMATGFAKFLDPKSVTDKPHNNTNNTNNTNANTSGNKDSKEKDKEKDKDSKELNKDGTTTKEGEKPHEGGAPLTNLFRSISLWLRNE
jgi:hypothetical protein